MCSLKFTVLFLGVLQYFEMTKENLKTFFEDKKNNLKARVDLFFLTRQEVDEISIMIRRPNESVYENQRLVVPGYYPEEGVFDEIRSIEGPAVLDIRVSDRNGHNNFVTIKKK